MEGRISGGQLRMMYGLARKCKLDNDALHDMAHAESLKTLSVGEANRVIRRLQALCGEEKSAPVDRASDAQQRKILALARALGWMDDARRLRGFLERFGASDVRFLAADKAGAVIEALKSMLDGGRGERGRAREAR